MVLHFVVGACGAFSGLVYMSTAAAQIALRRRRERSGGSQPMIKMWLVPYLSYVAIGCMGGVLIAMAYTPSQKQDFQVSCLTLIVSVVAYWIVRRVRQPRTAASAVT